MTWCLLTALTVLCGFPVPGNGRCITRLLAHSTAVKTTVDNIVTVGMLRWNWLLLLLLTRRVSMVNATCVAK